ncbi:MAG TPA: 5-dehydro-4-deoxy-D-glucuronate isomerase [Polyangia bacterium]|jgi:4-deoxy-L-threo-5-hexosulose-uronate ketol-isomerase|nr:5-dehydro-4-deoxy-D-glucuronate isomerase [Polyangia bacterium]
MQSRFLPDIIRYKSMDSAALRAAYLFESAFVPGKVELFGVDADRAVVGGAVPTNAPLTLPVPSELRATYFCERREIGIINIGGAGKVRADEQTFAVKPRECVYVGRGTKAVTFESDDPAAPAAFYLVSFAAHAAYPTVHAGLDKARVKDIGSAEQASRRRLHQYIHQEGIKSCQLVMGFTEIESGSVWNTMPPHTHTRRCEIYLYFDMAADARVMHFMGTPEEMRTLVVADRQVVASPAWSMHFGAGTQNYRFVWAMGGENQAFDDMDGVAVTKLR